MSVLYWRMVNGYSYLPYNGAVPGGLPSANIPSLPSPQTLAPASLPAPLQTQTAPLASPLPLYNPASALKWFSSSNGLPAWPPNALTGLSASSCQLLLGRRFMRRGSGAGRSVKCDTCNITLNSEQQAKQHYAGKNHLKKLKSNSQPSSTTKSDSDSSSPDKDLPSPDSADTGHSDTSDDSLLGSSPSDKASPCQNDHEPKRARLDFTHESSGDLHRNTTDLLFKKTSTTGMESNLVNAHIQTETLLSNPWHQPRKRPNDVIAS